MASHSLGTWGLGWQRSEALQISMLETISFKTLTQVIKAQSVGDGRRAPQPGWGQEGAPAQDTARSLLPCPLARGAFQAARLRGCLSSA